MKYAGIYIHIPFCAVKCMYCDFYSITDREDAIPQFVEAMCWEIKNCTTDVSDWEFDTIFIGGGTPSLLKAIHIDRILSCLNKSYDLSNVKEFTIEANPGEAPKDRLKDLKSMGINRLSIGVQSLQPQLLKFLTRIHSKEQVFETYNNARASGFNNINCDLIYSIPNQTLNMWNQDLSTIIKMEPEHISAYALTVEKGTDLFSMVYNNKISMQNVAGCSNVRVRQVYSGLYGLYLARLYNPNVSTINLVFVNTCSGVLLIFYHPVSYLILLLPISIVGL